MRNFYYALKQVFRQRFSNFTKLITLVFGVVIGGSILCRSAFMDSFDRFLPDFENTHFLVLKWNIANKGESESLQGMGPMAPELMDNIPAIKVATRYQNWGNGTFKTDSATAFSIRMLGVDSLFFDVLDYGVLKGDPHKALGSYDLVMLSEGTAKKMFGNQDPIGKILTFGDTKTYTVAGIFRDIPSNSHLHGIEMLTRCNFRGWDAGDSYYTYFKTEENVSLDDLTEQIKDYFAPRFVEDAAEGWGLSFEARHLSKWDDGENMPIINLILFILGVTLIVMSGLNFALLEINSLVSRTKEVGVHKASGASSRGVFMLLIWETVIYIVLALILSVVLLWGAKQEIESFAGKYDDIFNIEHLWMLGIALLMLLIFAGVVPAVLYARVPVTQVFQRLTSAKLQWKQALLFVQFVVAIFVVCVTITLVRQYNTLTTYDLGYDYKQLYTVGISSNETQRQTLKNELLNISGVEGVTWSNGTPNQGLSGMGVYYQETGEVICSARFMYVDTDFFATYGIPIMQGEILLTYDSLRANRVAMVNQQLLRLAGNTSLADAKLNLEKITRIGGVCRDFAVGTLYEEQQPLILEKRSVKDDYGDLTVRLKDPDNTALVEQIKAKIKAHFPDNQDDLWSFEQLIEEKYSTERMIRDGVIVAAMVLFIISLLGIIGYVSTEVSRRRGEIAVRRVHGAGAWSVVMLIARRLLIVAFLSSVIALPAAYIVGDAMLSLFAVKTDLAWWVFASSAGMVILTVMLCVGIQTYKTATSNPARFIKSE